MEEIKDVSERKLAVQFARFSTCHVRKNRKHVTQLSAQLRSKLIFLTNMLQLCLETEKFNFSISIIYIYKSNLGSMEKLFNVCS